MALRIEDYALIGDLATAALVGRDGSIDWMCVPRFDSGACFAALLGTPENGRWLLAPSTGAARVRRRYRGDTLVLETEFETGSGAARIIDFMPPLTGHPTLVRIIEGIRGRVEFEGDLTIRFDYGSTVPWVRNVDGRLVAVAGPDGLVVTTPVEMHGEGFHTVCTVSVAEHDRVPFVLQWFPSHTEPPPPVEPNYALDATERWWSEWTSEGAFQGEWRDMLTRSLITLKAMTYAPTGGVVAAPTTSLPEAIGGSRNWDYRYCWLRDATFTLYAFYVTGYTKEASAWRDWLLRAIAGTPSQVQIMYGVAGERRLDERELSWLPGYEDSRPVRVGNGAHQQLQLDTYGEVIDALYLARRAGIGAHERAWSIERVMLEALEGRWRDPDNGIWEVQGPLRHFTHSKVMAWVAFDRAIKAAARFGLDAPVGRWAAIRAEIHERVCKESYNGDLRAFVQSEGSRRLDASLLMMPLVGFLPATDERLIGTVAAIRNRLEDRGFVWRYEPGREVEGFDGSEGAFLVCTLWMADNLAMQGRRDEALEYFNRVVGVANDVGLLSEQYDPATGRQLGNFPQALSHVGLVNAVRNLGRSPGAGPEQPV